MRGTRFGRPTALGVDKLLPLLAWLLAPLLGLTLGGCADQPAAIWAEPSLIRPDGPAGLAPGATASVSGLTITLRPRTDPTPGLAVYLDLRGPLVGSLRTFALAGRDNPGAEPAAIRYLSARDGQGVVDAELDAVRGRITLARAPAGDRLHIAYLAEGSGDGSGLTLRVSSSTVSGIGYGFLALPEVDTQLAVRLRWQLDAVEALQAASSFGLGTDVVGVARPSELAHSLFVAGHLLIRESSSGDRLIALGEPSWDPERTLAFCDAALGAARRLFEPTDTRPFTFVFVAEPGRGSRLDGAAAHHSFMVWLDRERQLDARVRILLTHEIVHRWIGSELRFVKPDGSDAKWFSEGLAVHYARTLLLRERLIEPEEFLDDVRRDISAQALGSLVPRALRRSQSAIALPHPHASKDYQRGSLYAARLNAELGEAGKGDLDPVVLSLLDAAQALGTPLPESSWEDAMVEALGPVAGEEFERLMVGAGEPIEVPDGAFGPCFYRAAAREAVYELGFDRGSLDASPALLRGVRHGSQADRAGLRDGLRVVSGASSIRAGDPSHPIRLVVSDDDGAHLVSYLPQRWQEQGSWQLSDSDSCRAGTADTDRDAAEPSEAEPPQAAPGSGAQATPSPAGAALRPAANSPAPKLGRHGRARRHSATHHAGSPGWTVAGPLPGG
jgi:hypothetical protein